MGRIETGQAVVVHEHSDDIFTAAKLEDIKLPASLASKEVLIKMLAAPVNPSDVMCISGHYGEIAECPFVVGFEGVAEILEIGSDVTSVVVGDWVLPGKAKFGTWRSHGVYSEDAVFKVDKRLGFKAAASLVINPCTAYLMLTTTGLEPGDSVIQNGANSTVGLGLIQMAKSMGIHTINVVRNRANLEELVSKMTDLGADIVITDEQLRKKSGDWDGNIPKPKLAIDCVGGDGGNELVRHLIDGGTMMNYGCMSGQPLTATPNALIFRDIKFCGFWLRNYTNAENFRGEVLPYIGKLAIEGKYQFPDYELFPLKDYQSALKRATGGFTNKKQLLVMDESLL